ncbi:hypothetical protein [Spartinivicinus poritis]|uniref:Uncharacterized protein n=1 Tax=Spartinivicinus poritis TaxID=2994640 RepID=A0ABT5U5T5_9GAMM|nr:hypothetical protein [Spartinivicinus sp. A2-2]MDE1460917.1 hypothetical protein [Spartinivicinus sp. A2-2]
MKKVITVLSLLFVLIVSGAIFTKWAEKGLAEPYHEEVSPNGKFKAVIYDVAEYTAFAKLYDNETGEFIAESPIIEAPEATGIHWEPNGYIVRYGMTMMFDIGEYDTKYSSFSELRTYK